LTYTVQNTGGRPVGALLTDDLPAALAPIYVEADQGTCDGDATLTCALGSIGPGRSIDVVVVAQVVAAASFANDAELVAADDGVAADGPPTLRFKATAAAAVRLALPH
jgi:hypothetical protein